MHSLRPLPQGRSQTIFPYLLDGSLLKIHGFPKYAVSLLSHFLVLNDLELRLLAVVTLAFVVLLTRVARVAHRPKMNPVMA